MKKEAKKTKIISIEGTDCSGKATQTMLLLDKLKKDKEKIETLSFPMYDTPTGKVVGGPLLGKERICECWFDEGPENVDPKVAALYYAADRKYNSGKIFKLLEDGYTVLLDRYVWSNMAHQGGKLKLKKDRIKMYKWFEKLEFGFLGLPKPDLTIFLYLPYDYTLELKKHRTEPLDQIENKEDHLRDAERAYLELAELYGFKMINCVYDNKIKTKEEISKEVYKIVSEFINS